MELPHSNWKGFSIFADGQAGRQAEETDRGDQGKGEGGKRGEEGEGKLLRTDGSKALQEVLADLKTPK